MKKELIPAIEYAVYEMLSSEFQETIILTPATVDALYLHWKEIKEKDQYKMEDLALDWIHKHESMLKKIDAENKTVYVSIFKTPMACGGERTLRFEGDGFAFSMRVNVQFNPENRKQEMVAYIKNHHKKDSSSETQKAE